MTIFPSLTPSTTSILWPWGATSPNLPCSLFTTGLCSCSHFSNILFLVSFRMTFYLPHLAIPFSQRWPQDFYMRKFSGGTLKGKKTGDLFYSYICITKTRCYWDYTFHLVQFGGLKTMRDLSFLIPSLILTASTGKVCLTPSKLKRYITIVHLPLLENLHCIRDVVYLSI